MEKKKMIHFLEVMFHETCKCTMMFIFVGQTGWKCSTRNVSLTNKHLNQNTHQKHFFFFL